MLASPFLLLLFATCLLHRDRICKQEMRLCLQVHLIPHLNAKPIFSTAVSSRVRPGVKHGIEQKAEA